MYSQELIDHCINACTLYYIKYRQLAKPPDIYADHKDFYDDVLQIAGIMETPAFKTGVQRRGVPWKRRKGLDTRQMLALQAVMSSGGKESLNQRLKKIGVARTTWDAWMKDGQFASYVTAMGNDALTEAIPVMKTSLVNLATSGDLNAIRFALEVTGEYNPANQAVIEVRTVLAQVVEIISKHVTDPEALTRIGFELSGLVPGSNVTKGEVIGDYDNAPVITQASGQRPSLSFDGHFE